MIRIIAGVTAAALLGGCTASRLRGFERTLAAQDSATAALRQWCAARRLASPARITARQIPGADAPLPGGLGRWLGSGGAAGAIGYRHVLLACGPRVLSEAQIWYRRAALTPPMNEALAATDVPFGQIAAPLRFTRLPLDSRRGAAAGCPMGTILSHRALLRLPGGAPLALVVECYTAANLR